MSHVKTAISLDRPLFEQLDHLARDMHISRSNLLAQALAEYLERRHNREMLARINEACAEGLDEQDHAFLGFAKQQLRKITEDEE
jgi:predicted transcriptional regulator